MEKKFRKCAWVYNNHGPSQKKSQTNYHLGAQKRCLKKSFTLDFLIAQTFCCKKEGKNKLGQTTFKYTYSFVYLAYNTNLYCQSSQLHLISEVIVIVTWFYVLGCQYVNLLPLVSTMVVHYADTNPSKLLT